MLSSKELSVFLLFIYLTIQVTKIQGLYSNSVTYNLSFNDTEIISNSLISPGLAYTVCNSTNYSKGKIFCTLARETATDLSDSNHFQFCNVSASFGEKIFRKKTDSLGDNKAVMMVELSKSVTILIINLSNCQFVFSKIYKIYVHFASVHGSNGRFFDILYEDEFSFNNRRWTLDVNGTIVNTPQDESFKFFKKDKYVFSPTNERLLFGQPNSTSEMGLYSIHENGSTNLVKVYPPYYMHEISSSSLSTYGFLSTCFRYENATEACAQHDSNGILKFETIMFKELFLYLGKVQNLPGGGLLLFIDGCVGVEYHGNHSFDECKKYQFLKKISPIGQDLGWLKMARQKCEIYTRLNELRFFEKENGDYCISHMCGDNKNLRLNLTLTCFKNDEFQSKMTDLKISM